MKLKWKISLPVLLLLILSTLTITIINYSMTRNSVDQIVDNIVKSNLDTLVSITGDAEKTEQAVIDEMGKRKLAYLINDKPEGYYVLVKFTSGPEFPAELDRVLKITDGIMRSLITVIGE